MVIRKPLLALLFLGAATAVFCQNPGQSLLIQLPNDGGARTVIYDTDALNTPLFNGTGPTETTDILWTPDGSKAYFVTPTQIQTLDESLSGFQTLNGITGAIRAVKMTRDGKYLIVAADTLTIIDVATDIVAAQGLGLTEPISSIEVSRDSKRAWVMTQPAIRGTIHTINLTTLARVGDPYNLPFSATGLFLSPRGLLYITYTRNQVDEIDPATMQRTPQGLIGLNGVPGPLQFLPDGSAAYAVNLDRSIAKLNSMMRIDLSNPGFPAVAHWPTGLVQKPQLDRILIAGNNRVFAIDGDQKTLYEIQGDPLTATPTDFGGQFPRDQVLAAVVSQERPSARFLYALIDNGSQTNVNRIDLTTDTKTQEQFVISNSPFLRFIQIPAHTGASTFIQFPENVTLEPGDSLDLVAYVLDGIGRPVFNQTGRFQSDNPDVVIATPDVVTNAEGWVTTRVTAPQDPGIYTVQLTVGAAVARFTLIIPQEGGGTPGGPPLISIFRGNGPLFLENDGTSTYSLMTVKVVTEDGRPQEGVTVNFSLVEGPGRIGPLTSVTDEEGLASARFQPDLLNQGIGFISSKVHAASAVGAVDFTATTFRRNFDGTGAPEARIVSPETSVINIGQGDILPSAIVGRIFSGQVAGPPRPIPGVGMEIDDPNDATVPGMARCLNPLSDNNGRIDCNLQANCVNGAFGQYGIAIDIGGYKRFPTTYKLNIGPGSAQRIASLIGNGQTGRTGDTLQDLQAMITDNCGSPVPGAQTVWEVVEGDATLSNIRSVTTGGGRVSAGITLGQAPGPIRVRVSLAGTTRSVLFELTSEAVVSGISVLSGSGQTARVNQPFTNPVVWVVRDTSGAPIPNITLTFSITGNGGIGQTTGTTDAQGRAQTTVTAGGTPGTIRITAAFGTTTSVATLSVTPEGPAVTVSSFFNNASKAPGLSVCGLANVRANGLAAGITGVLSGVSPFGPLPYSLGDIDYIRVNGVAAPIRALSNQNGVQEAIFQVPCSTPPGTNTAVEISVGGTSTTTTGVSTFAAQPGIYTFAGPNGIAYGGVQSTTDGSFVTLSNLARRGGDYVLGLTGLGQVVPATSTNAGGIAGQNVAVPVILGINNAGVPVESAVYQQGQVGVYLVKFHIPEDFVTGTDLALSVGVVVNGQTVYSNPAYLPGIGQ